MNSSFAFENRGYRFGHGRYALGNALGPYHRNQTLPRATQRDASSTFTEPTREPTQEDLPPDRFADL